MPKSNNRLTLKQNMLWNSFGSLVYLSCQWLMTVLVVRLADGYDAAGVLSLAMSVYNMFSSLAVYRMYTYQVSDINHENSVGEYFGFRIITCFFALVVIGAYAYATCPLDALGTIISYAIYKISSLIIDVLHGLDQQHGRMDYIGKSLAAQGILSLFIFYVNFIRTSNLTITFLLMTVITIAVGATFDLPRAQQFEKLKVGISRKKVIHLFRYCFPIVIGAIACNAAPLVPRQILSSIDGVASLGVYSSVAAPVAIIQMGASYIYNPLLGFFSEAYLKKDMKQLSKLLLKASIGIAVLGVASAFALDFFGRPLLALIFGPSIASYAYLLLPIIACAMISAYVWFLSDVLVALRHFRGNFIGNVCSALLSVPMSFILIPIYGMNGVSFATFLSCGVGVLIMLSYLIKIFNR